MPIGTSDGQYFENVYEQYSVSKKKFDDALEIRDNAKSGDFQSRFYATDTAPTMPPGASEKLTDALESFSGTQVPGRQYETGLTKLEEQKFSEWKAQYAPKDSGEDYDFRGAFKAGITPAENGHWPDTFKKPNHPTFSVESQYAKDRPELAGRWDGETYIPPVRGTWDKLTGQTGERYQLWPEKAIRSVIEGVEAFGGKTPTWAMDPTTGEVRTDMQTAEKVFDAAGLAVFGPMPVAKKMVDGTLGSFAGVRSQLFKDPQMRKRLYDAHEQEMQGYPKDEIWENTGMFRGADNKWRFEISDAGMKLREEAFDIKKLEGGWSDVGNKGDKIFTPKDITLPPMPKSGASAKDMADWFKQRNDLLENGKHLTLEKAIDHPELFKAYPELKGIKIKEYPAEWNPEGKNLGMMWGDDLFIKPGQTPEMVRSIISHEVQHKIQDIEGFSRGANQNQFKSPKLTEAEEFFNKVKKQTEDEMAEKFGGDLKMVNQNKQWLKYELEYPEVYQALPEKNKSQALKDYESWKKSNPEDLKRLKDIVEAERLLKEEGIKRFDMYQKVRGEVEARNVQTRLNMEAWEREAVPPYRTEDFDRSVQTASPWDKGGQQMSASQEGPGIFTPYSRRWPNNDNVKPLNESQQFIKDYDKLAELRESLGTLIKNKNFGEYRKWSDLDYAKYNKAGREFAKKHDQTWEDVKPVDLTK